MGSSRRRGKAARWLEASMTPPDSFSRKTSNAIETKKGSSNARLTELEMNLRATLGWQADPQRAKTLSRIRVELSPFYGDTSKR
jgi:hypothetical protein